MKTQLVAATFMALAAGAMGMCPAVRPNCVASVCTP